MFCYFFLFNTFMFAMDTFILKSCVRYFSFSPIFSIIVVISDKFVLKHIAVRHLFCYTRYVCFLWSSLSVVDSLLFPDVWYVILRNMIAYVSTNKWKHRKLTDISFCYTRQPCFLGSSLNNLILWWFLMVDISFFRKIIANIWSNNCNNRILTPSWIISRYFA